MKNETNGMYVRLLNQKLIWLEGDGRQLTNVDAPLDVQAWHVAPDPINLYGDLPTGVITEPPARFIVIFDKTRDPEGHTMTVHTLTIMPGARVITGRREHVSQAHLNTLRNLPGSHVEVTLDGATLLGDNYASDNKASRQNAS